MTVVAGESWMAEVLAKAQLLRGSAPLLDLIGGTGAEAFAVTIGGHILATDGIDRFVGPPGLPDHIELAIPR